MSRKNSWKSWLAASLFSLVCFIGQANAQEIDAQVTINTQQLGGSASNKQYYDAMQRSIRDFITTRKWTTDQFSATERISANFAFTFTKRTANQTGDYFTGKLQVSYSRPVHGSSYSSPVLNVLDGSFGFNFLEGQFLDFNEGQFQPLSSLIGYYVNVILALDYDTYSPRGGSAYWTKARAVVQNAPSNEPGWEQDKPNNLNRFSLVNDIAGGSFGLKVSSGLYKYHRLGLDACAADVEKGRLEMLAGLEDLYKANQERPNTQLMQVLVNTKLNEFIGAFGKLPMAERGRAVQILKALDPKQSDRYDALLKNP